MRVDIYIRERNGSREIRIPWLPDAIQFESGGTVRANYEIMNKGDVEVVTGSGLRSYSWKSTFPGKNRTDESMLRGAWRDPKHYHNILEDWKEKGEPLNILVTGYPVNVDVQIGDYRGDMTGGFGDIDYEIKFVEDRKIVVTSTKVEKSSTNTVRSTPETKSYTIKSGDTLWAIAKKFLGNGAKWPSIYNANKNIIESTAKKYGKKSSNNGWWIFPGCTITISV